MPINSFLYPGAKITPAYEVANSCRFDGSSAVMEKTFGSAGNRDTFTLSCWVKRSGLSTTQRVIGWKNNGGGYGLIWEDTDQLKFLITATGSNAAFTTNRLFRDVSAWYHIVLKIDTTQATEADRMRVYINGVEETSFASRTYPNQNEDTHMNLDNKCRIGCSPVADNSYFSGYLAEVCFIDGSALAPTEFGEFDEDSPTIWKPKDVSGLTFGSNGFYLDFEDSGDLDDDESGNGNDFTASNLAATDQASDSPTNNFATLNPLALPSSANTFSEGNLIITNSADANRTSFSTIGVSGGKWYCEAKFLSGEMKQYIGISKEEAVTRIGESANSYGFGGENARKWNNDSYGSYGSTASTGDIIMVAFDADNGTIWVGKNGTWFASATEAEIEAGTTTNAMYSSITINDFFFIGASVEDSNIEMNFGNPPYAISSGNSDENGYGNFEYSVPDGFLALCTKNLGSDGG